MAELTEDFTTGRPAASTGIGDSALILGVALLGALTWRFVLGLELLGWDSYPLIAAGRVRSAAELLGTFGEELMDGRFPHGHFYRPITHLSFALDHALHGLEPWGYHLTDLLILAASAGTLALLVLRALGARGERAARIGAGTAGLAWVFHPAQLEIVTAAPRRADALAVLFLLVALVIEARRTPGGPARASRRPALACALLCALSIGAKETGAVAPLILLAFAVCRGTGTTRERLRAAARRLWPAFVATAAMIAVRTAVLGGLGGDRGAELAAALTDLPRTALVYARLLAVGTLGAGPVASGALALVVVLLALVLTTLARSERGGSTGTRLSIGAGALFALVWFTLVVAITGISGVEHAWYQLPGLGAWSLLCGLLAAAGVRARAAGRSRLGGVALVFALALVGLGAWAVPPLEPAPEFTLASQRERELLDGFTRAVTEAAPGARLRLAGPRVLDFPGTRGPSRRVHLISSYGLEAYAELTHPELQVRVLLPGEPLGKVSPRLIGVQFVPEREPEQELPR